MLSTASARLELLKKQLWKGPWPSVGSVAPSMHEGPGPQRGSLAELGLVDANEVLRDIAQSTGASPRAHGAPPGWLPSSANQPRRPLTLRSRFSSRRMR